MTSIIYLHVLAKMTSVIYIFYIEGVDFLMGASREQKEESRRAIIAVAARLFRERGVDGVTVAEIMSAAGLTHGGFPRHFANKQELVTEALGSTVDAGKGAEPPRARDISAFATSYLRSRHRDSPALGCVFAALGSEAARESAETRAVLTRALKRQIESFALSEPGGSSREHRIVAIGSWSAMVGALILARISDSEDLSDEILLATRKFLDT
jgi:TetR/AcrR family transcriptional repressor of nem operon